MAAAATQGILLVQVGVARCMLQPFSGVVRVKCGQPPMEMKLKTIGLLLCCSDTCI